MREQPAKNVKIQDPFWSPRLDVNARQAIFHQWEQLEASRCIDNFRLAAGEKTGFREGWFFADSDAYKWLDAASRISANSPHPLLTRLMDDLIELLGRTQMEDGYIFTYNQLHFPGQRWVALQVEHELYCHGHLIEAGVSHFEATGKTSLLNIATKAADLLVKDFLNTTPEKTCGHEEIELALLRLYRVTGREDYHELSRQFLERRGRILFYPVRLLQEFMQFQSRKKDVEEMRGRYIAQHPDQADFRIPGDNPAKMPPFIGLRRYINALRGFYAQQNAPIRQQTRAVGHSVRFGYLETAIAMLYRVQPDESLLTAMQHAWENMVTRRMYITGGLGALPAIEGFGRDYELDPEYAYAETCAALASLFWNWEMALITAEAQFGDLFEWQLYNAASVGLGITGETYLYNNPLACHGGITRQKWYSVPCCPSNLSRTWADLGKYIYSFDENNVWIHQLVGNETTLALPTPLTISTESHLPFNPEVTIRLDAASAVECTLHIRIPSWADGAQLVIGEETISITAQPAKGEATACGYDPRQSQFAHIHRTWQAGDTIHIHFDMPIRQNHAHPKVKGHAGKIAISRGPLVYCLESVDHPNVDIFNIQVDASSLRTEPAPELLGGITVLRGQTPDGQPVTFVPYFLWANRGESNMTVWVNA